MKQFRLLTLLALLMTAATGAWAQVLVTHSDQSVSNYGSLAEAFALSGDENANLQDGDVVTLLDDQTELTDILHLKNKQITFDLNGHSVSSSERVFNLTGSADLTLTSSQEGGTVNATFADTEVNHYAIRVGERCKLTIPESSKHFTISSNNTCIFDNGKVVIAGSPTISGTKGGFYSVEATQPVELTISGSPTITSDGYGFFVLSPSCQLTISGAPTISGKVNGIFAYCPVTISGQPKISSQGAAGQMGAIVPYDIMAYQLTIGGKAEHPATLDFTGTKATGNIILYYPISITGPVALGSADKWNVTIMDSEGFPTTGTFTSGWTTNMTDAAIADYFTGGQLSDGTNLIVTTDADGEGALAPTYSVSLNDGTLNPTTWTAKAGEATTFSALPLKGVTEGQPVTLKYNGRLKVKNVTATTDAEPDAWDGDLSKLTAESTAEFATATDGMTITGRLAANVKVSIAAGATVTLDGVTINGDDDEKYKWAGLNCLGDATIILKDGTENSVSGFYPFYPGIHVPAGSRLTITGGTLGNGMLTARSSGYGAGIGGGNIIHCGNIDIQGGYIAATGGIYAAGIGGGLDAICGNITISGGTVRAMGGPEAAGIGGGSNGRCGGIMITNGVTRVFAMKDDHSPYSIGAGNGGSCVTVAIGGTVYWQDNAAVNDGDDYLATNPLEYRPMTQP